MPTWTSSIHQGVSQRAGRIYLALYGIHSNGSDPKDMFCVTNISEVNITNTVVFTILAAITQAIVHLQQYGAFGSGEDGELDGSGCMEISEIFVAQDAFCFRAEPFDSVEMFYPWYRRPIPTLFG